MSKLISGFTGMLCAMLIAAHLQAQDLQSPFKAPVVAVESNLLYDAIATVNIGLKFCVNRKLTLDPPFNYKLWTFSDRKKIKHSLVQLELRYWINESFKRSFWGIHLLGAEFNTARIIDDYRYPGCLSGVGISFGNRWNLYRRWVLDATIGVGYTYLDYSKYSTDESSPDRYNISEGRICSYSVPYKWL